MSITIHNGYKLPIMTAVELNQFILRSRKIAEQKAIELSAKAMANLLSHDIDELAVFGKEEFIKRNLKHKGVSLDEANKKFSFCSCSLHSYMDMRNRYFEIQRTSQRDPAMDFDCSAIIIPKGESTLVLLYAELKEMREAWRNQPGITEYSYYDNVEKPEDVTHQEWEERKEVWLDTWGDKQAREVGMEVVFADGVPERHEIKLEQIATFVSPLEERAKYVAWNKLFDDKFRELKTPDKDWLDLNREVSRWIRSDEGKKRLSEVMEECKGKMFPELTVKHFRLSYEKNYNLLVENGKENN